MPPTIRSFRLALGLALLAFGAPLAAQYATATAIDAAPTAIDDQQFLREAAQAGLAEIEIAGVAGANALTDDVRRYAQRMAADYAKLNDALHQLAAARSDEALPAAPNGEQMALKSDLAARSGADFDRAYARAMRVENDRLVALFERAALSSDEAVRELAEDTLPMLREHRREAEALDRSLGGP
jgi:putative membrane protein